MKYKSAGIAVKLLLATAACVALHPAQAAEADQAAQATQAAQAAPATNTPANVNATLDLAQLDQPALQAGVQPAAATPSPPRKSVACNR